MLWEEDHSGKASNFSHHIMGAYDQFNILDVNLDHLAEGLVVMSLKWLIVPSFFAAMFANQWGVTYYLLNGGVSSP